MAKGKIQRSTEQDRKPKNKTLTYTVNGFFFLLRPQGKILKVLNIRGKKRVTLCGKGY